MKSIRGNLLALARSGRFDVIVHGCNCRHAMGAGIAKQIKDSFPEAWAADLATPAGGLARGDWSKIAAIIDEELAGETHTLVEYGDTDTEAV